MAYQSFPGEPGDSDSPAKLKALALPALQGKTVLDVGCNGGYFCGVAMAAGAAGVTGMDANAAVIEQARARFPGPTFLARSWDHLPEARFDVILLLSSIHYADDQPALIASLVSRLEDDGVLVLEMGIAHGEQAQWVAVDRVMDVRYYPTMAMMGQVLAGYNFRLIGKSVMQAGDPIPRYVFHIRRKRQTVILCLDGSGVGKSSLCRSMQQVSGGEIAVVALDDHVLAYHAAVFGPSAALTAEELIAAYDRICQAGALAGFAEAIARQVGSGPLVVLEGVIPAGYRTEFASHIRAACACDIWMLSPFQIHTLPTSQEASEQPQAPVELSETASIIGCIDTVRRNERGIALVGWAFDKVSGLGIDRMRMDIGGRMAELLEFSRSRRTDVCEKMGAKSDLVGFAFEIPLDGAHAEQLLEQFRLRTVTLKAVIGTEISRNLYLAPGALQ